MKKLTLICFGIINTFLLSACSSSTSGSSSDSNNAAWHNANSPFTLDTGDYINDNVLDNINLTSGSNNGYRYFVMPGDGSILLNSNNTWSTVTPAEDVLGVSDDFINFNVSPDGQTILAITVNHELLYFNGSTWANTKLDSCLTDPDLITDFAINADYTIATVLGSNGEMCQYDSKVGKWNKSTIIMPDDVDLVSMSNFAVNNGLYVFNQEAPSLTYFSDLTGAGTTIASEFTPDDLMDTGNDAFVASLNNNAVVLFSNTHNDFYYYLDDAWHDTALDVNQYGATKVIDRGYYFDTNGNPYIFAALDNMKVLAYYQGNWTVTPITIPSTALLSNFVLGLSTTSMRLFVEYEASDIENDTTHDILYDLGSNQVLDLNEHDDFIGMFGSTDLNYIYAVDSELKIYRLDLVTKHWQNTNFDMSSYGDASGISSLNVTNDGVLVLVLTNGAVTSYY